MHLESQNWQTGQHLCRWHVSLTERVVLDHRVATRAETCLMKAETTEYGVYGRTLIGTWLEESGSAGIRL